MDITERKRGDGVRAADGLRPRFNHTAQVVTAGADLGFGSSFLLGGAVESGRLSAKVAAGAGNFAVEDNGGRLYGVWQGGPASLVVDAGYGVIGLKGIHRTTAFGGFQTNGKGSGTHLGAELIKESMGLRLAHVPYNGGGPAVQAVLSAQTPIGFSALPPAVPLLQRKASQVLGTGGKAASQITSSTCTTAMMPST